MTTDNEINKLKKELPMVDLELLDDKRIAQLIMIAELKGRQESRKETLAEVEKIILKSLDEERIILNNLLYPMEKYNVNICLNNLLVNINKKLQKLKEKKE
jgi:hypothetical protein